MYTDVQQLKMVQMVSQSQFFRGFYLLYLMCLPIYRKNMRNFISLKCNSCTKYEFWKLLDSCAKSAHINTQVFERKLDG